MHVDRHSLFLFERSTTFNSAESIAGLSGLNYIGSTCTALGLSINHLFLKEGLWFSLSKLDALTELCH